MGANLSSATKRPRAHTQTAGAEAKIKHHVSSTLNYWDDPGDGSRPTPIILDKGGVVNKRPHRPYTFLVTDITGDEDKYLLDTNGFQYSGCGINPFPPTSPHIAV